LRRYNEVERLPATADAMGSLQRLAALFELTRAEVGRGRMTPY